MSCRIIVISKRSKLDLQQNLPDMYQIILWIWKTVQIMQFNFLIRYIKLVVELLGVKLIIFVNLRSYLSDRQFRKLIQEIKYQEIKVLFIENQEKVCIEGGMRYIIDKDGCEIY